MTQAEQADAEETAWQWFAYAHPHEAYATYPERFWKYFQTVRPGVSREVMEKVLKDTNKPINPK